MKTQTSVERIKIGECPVDSGKLLIVDPCYLETEFLPEEFSKVLGVAFWGKDAEKLAQELREQFRETITVYPLDNYMYLLTRDDLEEDELIAYCSGLIDSKRDRVDNPLWIVYKPYHDSVYQEICNTEHLGLHVGEVPSLMGVMSETGFGDGVYEVYATVKDYGKFGKRIAKLEIELITDKEVEEFQQLMDTE